MGTRHQVAMGKPRGLRTARKHVTHRREQRWHDKEYKKAHLGTRWKANPFGGASHAKGIVLEKVGVEAKQPNSAIRKCVMVQLIITVRRSQPSSPMMVASPSLKRTMKSWLPVSVVKVTPSVIFLVYVSRLSR